MCSYRRSSDPLSQSAVNAMRSSSRPTHGLSATGVVSALRLRRMRNASSIRRGRSLDAGYKGDHEALQRRKSQLMIDRVSGVGQIEAKIMAACRPNRRGPLTR